MSQGLFFYSEYYLFNCTHLTIIINWLCVIITFLHIKPSLSAEFKEKIVLFSWVSPGSRYPIELTISSQMLRFHNKKKFLNIVNSRCRNVSVFIFFITKPIMHTVLL